MKDFSISSTVAAWTAATLTILALTCYGITVAIYTGYTTLDCCSTVRARAYSISAILAFGTTSLFYARKVYLILFRNSESLENISTKHNLPFILYVLLRPIFGVLVSFLLLLSTETLIRSAVDNPEFSEGFVNIAVVSAILLSAVLGTALDSLPKAGKRLARKLEEITPNG